MDLDAFRAPGGQMHGASTKAILYISSRAKPLRFAAGFPLVTTSRWPVVAETLWAAAGYVAALRY
jgi:hypothetical protein